MSNQTTKKLPTRRCTGCGEHFPKNTLARILRTPEGTIVLDKTGRGSGRGAYICYSPICLKKARRASRIETSLDCKIPDEIYLTLEEELKING